MKKTRTNYHVSYNNAIMRGQFLNCSMHDNIQSLCTGMTEKIYINKTVVEEEVEERGSHSSLFFYCRFDYGFHSGEELWAR